MSADEAERQIINPGSSGVRATEREEQVAQLLAMGYSHKKIAARLGISAGSVGVHVHNLAHRIPGDGAPSIKVTVWYLEHHS